MSAPIIDPAELGTYLNDSGIDVERAWLLITDAQSLCESVISPLPAGAAVVVRRMAGFAYSTILSPRQMQAAAAGGQFVGAGGSVRLTDEDVADLRRLAGGGGAFSIDLLPAGYTAPSQFTDAGDWDQIV